MGLWSFVKPLATTNLITNPSFERGTTGYTAVGGSIARTTAKQTKGIYSGIVTPSAAVNSGGYYGLTLEAGQSHVFSLDFQGAAGIPYQIRVYDVTAGANLTVPATFIGDGTWRRYYIVVVTSANTNYRLYFEKNNSASVAPFYIDALQMEKQTVPTTYCDGDEDDCQWLAGEHQSQSYRSDQVASGGQIIDFSSDDYGFMIKDHLGVGMPPIELITTLPAQSDGEDYQRTITRPRSFQLVGTVGGESRTELHQRRNRLIKALNPHRIIPDQPVQLRYTWEGKSVAIDARYEGGLEKMKLQGHVETPGLRFRASEDPYFRRVGGTEYGAYAEGAAALQLAVQSSIANANYLLQRSAAGDWSVMGTGLSLPSVGVASDTITALAIGLDGSIYIGGSFASVGGVANTSRIARWDGTNWTALGTGAPSGTVYSIFVDPATGDVWVGGSFPSMGGVANTNSIARWNGSAWNAVGTGVTGGSVVARIMKFGNDFWVGGDFTQMGGVANTNSIARYNGSVWQAIGTGVTAGVGVRDFVRHSNGNIYVAGHFTTMGGVANTTRLAYWNGSAWNSVVTTGPDNIVLEMEIDDDDVIYLGGNFTVINGVANTYGVAKIVNNAIVSLGNTSSPAIANAILATPSGVYFGGGFTSFLGTPANKIAKISNGVVSALGNGINATLGAYNVLAIEQFPDGSIAVGGLFPDADGQANTNNLARWNEAGWQSVGTAAKSMLQAADGSVYVGGGYVNAGGNASADRISRWFNSAWNAMGTGANGVVRAIAEAPNGYIYIGGSFTSVGGVANTVGIAYWNGSSWNALSTGIVGTVRALAFAPDGTLYIGGQFANAGGVANTKNLATWNGSAFGAVSTGANGSVNALVFDAAHHLYIGGAFSTLGGVTCNNIGRWDGSTFYPLSTGLNGYVNSLLLLANNNLVLGGAFTMAGVISVNYIAQWNGSQFSPLASGMNGIVYTLAQSRVTGKLYAGGAFTMAGGVSLPDKAAIYSGADWAPLPVNLPGNATVDTMIITATDQVYMGFDTAGTVVAASVS